MPTPASRSSTCAHPRNSAAQQTHMPDYPQEGTLRGGHIKGARSVPWARAANPDGTFKSADELRAIYEKEQGLKPGRRRRRVLPHRRALIPYLVRSHATCSATNGPQLRRQLDRMGQLSARADREGRSEVTTPSRSPCRLERRTHLRRRPRRAATGPARRRWQSRPDAAGCPSHRARVVRVGRRRGHPRQAPHADRDVQRRSARRASRYDSAPLQAHHAEHHDDRRRHRACHAERAMELSVNKYCSVKDSLATDIPIEWNLSLNE